MLGPNLRRGGPYPLAALDRGGSKFANGFGPGSISRGVQILHDQNSRNFLFTDFLDPVFFSYSPHSSSAISDYQWSDYLDYNMITNISNWKGQILRSFAIHISQEYEKINLVHLFVVLSSCVVSISMISISLDLRKVQKSYVLANVNVDGKHLKQIKKINIPQHLLIVHCWKSV